MDEIILKINAIIESCSNCEQLVPTKKYIDLFFKMFKNDSTYNMLIHKYELKKVELNCNLNA